MAVTNPWIDNTVLTFCVIIVFRAYSMLEEAAFLHNFTKAQELVALAYLVRAS